MNDDDLEEEDTSLLSVIRHIRAAPKPEEDCKPTLIFRSIVCCGTEARMIIIDGGSDIVFAATVERLKLPMESHPRP